MSARKAQSYFPNLLLKQARLERGWSQKQVADLLEAPQTFMVSRWENGTTIPGPIYRERLCKLFGKSYQELGFPELPSLSTGDDSSRYIFDPTIPLRLPAMRALIGRDLHLKQAKSLLCQEQAPFLALHGLPGVGKTALAAAIVYETEIQQQFSDGIVWIGLGQKPRVLTHLSRLGILLNLNEKVRSSLRTHAQWLQALGHIIGMRRMLIVIDDAWSLEDVAACLVGGPACAYLLTTRLPEVAVCFAESHVVQVSELSQQEGVQLLQRFVPTLAEQESEALARLAQAVGGLPLALTLIGSYLLVRTYHQHSRRVQKALLHLQQVESRLLLEHPQTALVQDPRLPAGTPLSLHAVIRVSETVLDISSRCALAALSLFPAKPNTFSEEAAL
ncbi:MAG: helix-turn-helix domain-containing protein, partial [Ktedonobacteraceae bacterium]|nr:helix-turn-helix domain-containing protein [Ktedonobacteraceae bacterium]